MVPYKETVIGGVRGSLWLLFGAVSVLLLIACSNIAALLLSRAARREQEVALRFSLGASRAAVAGQLLTETAVLAFAGAAAGLLVAASGAAAIRRWAPELPRLHEIGIDARILYKLGGCYESLNRLDEADRIYQTLVSHYETTDWAYRARQRLAENLP